SDRRIKADSHIESENMHISTAHLVGRLKTTAIQHKSLNLGHTHHPPGFRLSKTPIWQNDRAPGASRQVRRPEETMQGTP
ncbi:MAG: hypothetical protein UMU76_06740, partial [Prosthecochloris sp.]|nr:hypothetical protein [Prosthecochloris sp.]